MQPKGKLERRVLQIRLEKGFENAAAVSHAQELGHNTARKEAFMKKHKLKLIKIAKANMQATLIPSALLFGKKRSFDKICYY